MNQEEIKEEITFKRSEALKALAKEEYEEYRKLRQDVRDLTIAAIKTHQIKEVET